MVSSMWAEQIQNVKHFFNEIEYSYASLSNLRENDIISEEQFTKTKEGLRTHFQAFMDSLKK